MKQKIVVGFENLRITKRFWSVFLNDLSSSNELTVAMFQKVLNVSVCRGAYYDNHKLEILKRKIKSLIQTVLLFLCLTYRCFCLMLDLLKHLWVDEKVLAKKLRYRDDSERFLFIRLFIKKQPIMAGQDLKMSLATQRLKKGTHIHSYKTIETEIMVDREVKWKEWVLWQKQTRQPKHAQGGIFR